MRLRSRIQVVWQIDGKEFTTTTERERTTMPSIQEKVRDAEHDVREHEILARQEAKTCDPSPIRMEYLRVRDNGEVVLMPTPMYILGIFGKRLTRS